MPTLPPAFKASNQRRAWAVTLPAMLRLAASQPTAALATLAIGASLALWGIAIGAFARNGRLFELIALLFAYAGLQRAAISNVMVSPADTLHWHLLALPVAIALCVVAAYGGSRANAGGVVATA